MKHAGASIEYTRTSHQWIIMNERARERESAKGERIFSYARQCSMIEKKRKKCCCSVEMMVYESLSVWSIFYSNRTDQAQTKGKTKPQNREEETWRSCGEIGSILDACHWSEDLWLRRGPSMLGKIFDDLTDRNPSIECKADVKVFFWLNLDYWSKRIRPPFLLAINDDSNSFFALYPFVYHILIDYHTD